jgi:signal transduction histidine kinase/CheY-like chemotaxis protein/HPt (histidine-containing phosphotransfer) domain-containing protein
MSDPSPPKLPAPASNRPMSVVTAPRALRLRTLLTVPFVLLIVVPALIIAGTSLYTGLQAVDVLSRQLMDDISARVGQAAVHQLEEAAVTLLATFPNAEDSQNASLELFADSERLERKLFELTAAARTTAYLYFGREDGGFVGVDRGRPGARAAATVRLQDGGGVPRKSYASRTPGDRTRLIETETRIFEARARPWYQLAKSAQRLTWTPIYVSFASGALVTTAAQPIVSSTGSLFGVLAADVELSELSSFMKSVAVSANGVAFIVDRDGLLVASSTSESPFKTEAGVQKRVAARDSQSELVRAGAQWWRSSGRDAKVSPNIALISSGGEQVDVASRRVVGVAGIDWDIVVAVPRSDFTAPIVKSAISMFFVILAALAAALMLGLYVLRRVTRDVDQLVAVTRDISADGLPSHIPVTSLAETGVLAQAFSEMVARLAQSLETIRTQNDKYALLNATLEDRVERRTTQLGEQNLTLTEEILRRERLERELRHTSQAAQKAGEDKARFLAILSHELRTPLQAVVGASQLLSARGVAGQRADEIETLDAASKSLLTLIDGVLSYSRLEAGVVTPTLNAFTLGVCLDEALRVAGAALSHPEVALAVDIERSVPAVIYTDQGMLRQVLINLVGNALKFTRRGEVRVEVRADPIERAGEPLRVRFAVTDTGTGIDLTTQQRLFQPFQQGHHEPGQPPVGSGLGLVICSMLVRALGGEITMSSEPGVGTRMSFSILAQTQPMVASASPDDTDVTKNAAPQSLRVMVVEDNDVNRELLGIMLEQLGHQVVAVADGEAAVTACETQFFDAVLMDLNLPRIGGVEAARRILLDESGRRPPGAIIAFTASASEEDRALCRAAGMVGFLTKPATVFSLDAALRSAVESGNAAPSVNPPTEGVLNLATLASLAELDGRAAAPFLRRLIEQFIEGLPAHMAEIESHHTAGSPKETRAAAHGLAGGAAAVGGSALARCAGEMSEQPSTEKLAQLVFVAQQTTEALTSWLTTQVIDPS